MNDDITIGEKYGPAMLILEQSQANTYFEKCVEHCMRHGRNRKEAEAIERSNLGYYAGYYNDETQARVQKLFRCVHPVFGALSTSTNPAERASAAFQAGLKMGEQMRKEAGL